MRGRPRRAKVEVRFTITVDPINAGVYTVRAASVRSQWKVSTLIRLSGRCCEGGKLGAGRW